MTDQTPRTEAGRRAEDAKRTLLDFYYEDALTAGRARKAIDAIDPLAIEAEAYDEYKEATDAAMNFGEGFAEGRRKALLELKIDLRNASVVPAAGEDAVLCTDIDAVIDAAIAAKVQM